MLMKSLVGRTCPSTCRDSDPRHHMRWPDTMSSISVARLAVSMTSSSHTCRITAWSLDRLDDAPGNRLLEAGREQAVDVLVEEVEAHDEGNDPHRDADRVVAEVPADLPDPDRDQDQRSAPQRDLEPRSIVVEPAITERVLDLTGRRRHRRLRCRRGGCHF